MFLDASRYVAATPASSAVLGHLAAFCDLYAESRNERRSIIETLSRGTGHVIGDLLGLLELEYRPGTNREPRTRIGPAYEDLEREEVAAGVSCALELLLRARKGPPMITRARGNVLPLNSLRTIVLRCFRLREIDELEVAVFRLGYHCRKLASQSFSISAPSVEFGTSLSIGYFRYGYLSSLRHQIDAADDANALDLQQFCNELTPVLGPSSFQLTWDHGRPKLRFEVTEPVFDKVGELLVKGDGVLKEEEPHVRSACEEVGLEYAELLEMRVHEKVSIRDLLRIQRALRFLAYVRNSFLTREGIDDADAARVLPIDSDRHSFEMILSRFGVSPESCSSALDVMGWTAESDSFLDLLYKPFIFHHGSRVSVPLLTASAVNVVRNTLWSTRKRPRASGEVDLLSEGLKRAFAHTGWRTCSHLKYKHGAREGEVDFLVVAPRGIFFFECKETLHPCSTFELRRTLDHLDDAFDQLDRFQAALADPSFLKELSERLGEDLRGKRMTGSVVLSHWLLSGAPVGNYSIHNCGEVCNFVATGAAALWVRRTKYKVPLRASGPLSEPDLHEFLNVAGRELDALRRAGVPEVVDWRLPGSGTRLQTTHYPFDPLEQLAVLPMLPDAKREEFSALVHRALDADADGDVASELTNLLAGLERYFVSRREQAP